MAGEGSMRLRINGADGRVVTAELPEFEARMVNPLSAKVLELFETLTKDYKPRPVAGGEKQR